MLRIRLIYFILVLSGSCFNSFGQIDTINNAELSKDAPSDKAHHVEGTDQQKQYEQMVAPYIEQALRTLPNAKQRFLTGLPHSEVFFLVTRIYDSDGRFEQVFVRVKKWDNDKIKGTIANDLYTVKDFHNGQLIEFKEKDILDWLISKPDGTEEGNFIGRFLDTLNK
jgi:uncharacterized protein YegJ (DUF2314 family)